MLSFQILQNILPDRRFYRLLFVPAVMEEETGMPLDFSEKLQEKAEEPKRLV